jgi:hypothetical protein
MAFLLSDAASFVNEDIILVDDALMSCSHDRSFTVQRGLIPGGPRSWTRPAYSSSSGWSSASLGSSRETTVMPSISSVSGRRRTTSPLPRSLRCSRPQRTHDMRRCFACSSRRACAAVRRGRCAGMTWTSQTAFCGSVARSRGSLGIWVIGEPQTERSRRDVPLPPQL